MTRLFGRYIVWLTITLILIGCEETVISKENQNYMAVNTELNNKGDYSFIKINRIQGSKVYFQTPSFLQSITNSWIMGQGNGKEYSNTGKEVTFSIDKIDHEKGFIQISNPELINRDEPVTFWNPHPEAHPTFDSLPGSWGHSTIIKDSSTQEFKTILYQCDNKEVNLRLASSSNPWRLKVNKQPILTAQDFQNIPWNTVGPNEKLLVTPIISDIELHNGKYYLFAYGDDSEKKTYIGLITCGSLEGPFEIKKLPILSPDPKSNYSNHDVYNPHVVRFKNKWLMYYTGKKDDVEEYICVAESQNLVEWSVLEENIIPRNEGWNDNLKNQMVAGVKADDSGITLFVTGSKSHDSGNRKGNVLDMAIGKFTSPQGTQFKEEPGNPFFGGDPISPLENDHIGAIYQELDFWKYSFTFFHAKGIDNNTYTPLVIRKEN